MWSSQRNWPKMKQTNFRRSYYWVTSSLSLFKTARIRLCIVSLCHWQLFGVKLSQIYCNLCRCSPIVFAGRKHNLFFTSSHCLLDVESKRGILFDEKQSPYFLSGMKPTGKLLIAVSWLNWGNGWQSQVNTFVCVCIAYQLLLVPCIPTPLE